jgi:uncharacterized protein
MNTIDKGEIARLTEKYGGAWGINHTRRLLQLISLIGEGVAYDPEVVWLAAYLHDWGGYGPWAESGTDHVERSLQVVEPFLAEKACPDTLRERVLECIAGHHASNSDMSMEAILLRDADVLDFLGAVGILRDFSKNPKDLRRGYETAVKRRAKLPQTLFLDKSKELAEARLLQMDEFLEAFRVDSAGHF